jgi:hypothetical protein
MVVMGIGTFFKKLFGNEDTDEKELEAARARHGIVLSAKDKVDMNQATSDEERMADEYDVWDDLKQMRSSFFIGGWAAKKFHVVGDNKVKKELEALQKKREEKAKTEDWEKWGKK